MTVYISISKKDRNEDSPEGCENWFVLVNAPFLSSAFEWTSENKESYRIRSLKR